MNYRYISLVGIFVLFFSLTLLTNCKKNPPEPAPIPPTPVPTNTPIPEPTPIPTQSPEELRLIKLNQARSALSSSDIYFDFDKATLTETAKSILAQKADFLLKHSDIKVVIEGHCDERGSNEYNIGLGERRASAAKKYLIAYGVNESLIDTVSYGEEKPICFEHDESCWKLNRRVHFSVQE